MTLIDFLDDWLENDHKEYIKHQTYVRYRSNINNYIRNSGIAQKEMNEVTRRDIQDFVNSLKKYKSSRTGKVLSPGTVNNTLNLIQAAYGYAEEYELVDKNPCNRIHRVPARPDSSEAKCFTVAEQKRIEHYIDGLRDPEYYCYILDLYTGLRIGELCALTWDDINFTEGMLSVNKTIYISVDDQGKWGVMTDTPKTKSSYRTIPLPAHVLNSLMKIWKHTESPFVCSLKDNSRMAPWVCRWRYDEMLKKIGIRHLNFHCLRHTFATRALENGMDVRTLSEILGHSNPSVTLGVYTHSLADHKREMMNRMKRI